MEATAFLIFGLATVLFVHRSQKPEVIGKISAVERFHGKHAGSYFEILAEDGTQLVPTHCRYTGPALVDGELARVRYLAYDRRLLEIEILSGPSRGWGLSESDDCSYGFILVFVGALCGLVAATVYVRPTTRP